MMLFALGLGGQALAADNNNMTGTGDTGNEAVTTEAFLAFETDDLEVDGYGYYDEDFYWEAEEDRYDDWYGTADEDWNDTDWGYDDPGDAGWFDV